MYWKSAQPVSIVESAARTGSTLNSDNYLYFRIMNNGAYPIRIIGIVGADGNKATWMRGYNCGLNGTVNISDYFYLGPGEEKYFANDLRYGTACDRQVFASLGGSVGYWIGGAASICQTSTASPGTLDYKSFGFEYIEYLDNNQQITKRQIGKELIIKCREPYS